MFVYLRKLVKFNYILKKCLKNSQKTQFIENH